MDLQFGHPLSLTALAALPLAWLLYRYLLGRKAAAARRIGDPALVEALTANYAPTRFRLKYLLGVAALVLLVLALADPRSPGKEEPVSRSGVDLVLALDLSNSMLAEDLKPNRLAHARRLALDLLDRLEDCRVGLVVFAGRAYLQMPLSRDHAAARLYIGQATPETVPAQGTALAAALRRAASAFSREETTYRSIVLLTDGEDHQPEEIAGELSAQGIVLHVAGIGGLKPVPVPGPGGAYKKDRQGNTVLTALREESIRGLAAATGGIYLGPDELQGAADRIADAIGRVAESARPDLDLAGFTHYYPGLLLVAIVLLGVEQLIPERKRLRT